MQHGMQPVQFRKKQQREKESRRARTRRSVLPGKRSKSESARPQKSPFMMTTMMMMMMKNHHQC
jgi:hypothetical protein